MYIYVQYVPAGVHLEGKGGALAPLENFIPPTTGLVHSQIHFHSPWKCSLMMYRSGIAE